MRARPLAAGSALLALLALPAARAGAHEHGALHLALATVQPGDTLRVVGDHMEHGATLRLELRGTLATLPLGEVRCDSAGRFEAALPLASNLRPGHYALVAIADDGDEAGRAELTIAAAGAHAGVAAPPGAPALAVARADAMPLEPAASAPASAVVLGFVAVCLAGGLLLLRRAG